MASYTHVGCKANVGYTHHGSRLFGHGAPRPGRRHALNGGPDRFTSLCGEAVEADTHDQYGFRREGGPANVAAAGGRRRSRAGGARRRRGRAAE